MAKQLYDYWFVQFDFPDENGKPYKSSGGKMVWNDKLKMKIPEEWDCKTIKHLSKISKESITPLNNPMTCYKHYSIPAFDQCHSYSLEYGDSILSDKFLVEPNMIMVSKLNPWSCRTIFSMDLKDQVCSTEYVCLKERICGSNGFLYYLAKSEKFISYCTQGSTGTSHSHRRVNPDFMLDFKIAYNDDIIIRFTSIVISQIHKINNNQEEIRILTKQRDKLLPLLMNGQVSINSDLSKDIVSSDHLITMLLIICNLMTNEKIFNLRFR